MRVNSSRVIEVIDSHTEGNPTRVVVGGVPTPPGDTVQARQSWLAAHDDGLRTALNFEPRGNPMMCSVLLMPPIDSAAHFSALLMEQDEYVPMCGHCIIGAATSVVAAELVAITGPSTTVVFETPAGLIHCAVDTAADTAGRVTFDNVPSFLLHRDAVVHVDGLGALTVDVAFGGDFYAIVDADALGLAVGPQHERELGGWSQRIVEAIAEQLVIAHPQRPEIDRLYEVLWTTAATSAGTLRHAVVSPPATFDRSPCGTGSSARLASLWARGEVQVGESVQFAGVLGTTFTATATTAVELDDGTPAVVPRIGGRAYITARSTVIVDRDDPFPAGYRIGAPTTMEAT